MTARMNGNFERMIHIGEGLDRLATDGMRDAEHRAAVALYQQAEKQFTAGESAEGNKWADLAKGGPSHLQKSGDMKRSMKVRGVGGIKMTIDRPMGFHQSGTKNADGSQRMPARPVAPVGDSLPPAWDEAVKGAIREVVAQELG